MRPITSYIQKYLLATLPFALVFISSLYHPYDPDLGWHLKYGEYFFDNFAVLRENTFSSQMPSYEWANHSWGTDVIAYATYINFGFLGLAILSATVITLTFFFFAKAAQLNYFEKALIFPLLIYLLSPINSVSLRSQLLSLLAMGILIYILSRLPKHIFWLVGLFLIWANIHGQFILGVAVFFFFIVFLVIGQLIDKGLGQIKEILKEYRYLLIIFCLAILATLVNPFGTNIWQETLRHFANPLQKYIQEWLPPGEMSFTWWNHLIVGLILFFGSLFIIFGNQLTQKRISLGIVSIFFIMSFMAKRYGWTMYYLSIPIMAPAAAFLAPDSKKYSTILGTIILLFSLGLLFFLDNPLARIKNMGWESYCQKYMYCSGKAVEFLIDKNYKGELLTLYNWGGYIIWNYPQVKPTIDGRMTLWRDETGYSAFENYYALEQNFEDIDRSVYDVVLTSKEKPIYFRLLSLAQNNKWQLAYNDNFAAVFVRKDTAIRVRP